MDRRTLILSSLAVAVVAGCASARDPSMTGPTPPSGSAPAPGATAEQSPAKPYEPGEIVTNVSDFLGVTAEAAGGAIERTFKDSIDPKDYSLIFRNYGKNAVLGPVEPDPTLVASHEIFVLIDVVGKTESIAKTVCGVAKQFFLHLRYPGILCTSGNVAHPFSPDVMPAGAVYEFNVYHLLPVDDPCELFPIEIRNVG